MLLPGIAHRFKRVQKKRKQDGLLTERKNYMEVGRKHTDLVYKNLSQSPHCQYILDKSEESHAAYNVIAQTITYFILPPGSVDDSPPILAMILPALYSSVSRDMCPG